MKKEIDKLRIGSEKRSRKSLKLNNRKHNRNESSLRNKVSPKNNKKNKSSNFYYSFLTIVLLIFLSQVVFSAILNITKNISYQAKIATIKKSKLEAEQKNQKLKKELKDFSSVESLEAIARNNLKMAGDDEVLIIINEIKKQKTEEENKNKNKKMSLLYKLGKHDK